MGSPWGWISTGVMISVLGAICLALAEDRAVPLVLGYAGAGLGGLVTLVGAIGAGVAVGLEHHERDRTTA